MDRGHLSEEAGAERLPGLIQAGLEKSGRFSLVFPRREITILPVAGRQIAYPVILNRVRALRAWRKKFLARIGPGGWRRQI